VAATLKGERQLRARLRALRKVFKPIGKAWAEDTATYSRAHIPVKTGATRKSVRIRNASQKRATVVGRFPVNFIDAGTRAHDERPKRRKAMRYGTGDNVMFAKKVHHPATNARPFKKDAAQYGLRKNPMAVEVIRQWNDAA